MGLDGRYIRGADRLVKRLRILGRRDMKQTIARATRVTSKAIAAAVRPTLPVRSGTLRRNVKVRSIKRSSKFVGTRASFTAPTGPEFYGYFLEWGWHPARHSTKTTALPTQFTAQHVGKDGKVTEKTYRRDRRANAVRQQLRRQSKAVNIAGRKSGVGGGVKFRNAAVQGEFVPGRHWLRDEVRNKKRYYRVMAKREIHRALQSRGI